MARDVELNRLYAIQEEAFQKKQRQYQVMKEAKAKKKRCQIEMEKAWDDLSTVRDEMNREHDIMERNRATNDTIWEEYHSIKDKNNSRIEDLKLEADELYQNMSNYFEQATSEYEYGDRADAKTYSIIGHEYEDRLNKVNDRIRELGAEVKQARLYAEGKTVSVDNNAFKAARERFLEAKRMHKELDRLYKEAKVEAVNAEADFNAAKEQHQNAEKAVKKRLAELQNQKKQRVSEEDLMDRAGIPFYYRKDCKIRKNSDGSIDFFFGGLDVSDGLGHGHVSMDSAGHVTYNRSAFDKHGAQNFTDYQERQNESLKQHKARFSKFINHGVITAGIIGAVFNPSGYGAIDQLADYTQQRREDLMSQYDTGRWDPESSGGND